MQRLWIIRHGQASFGSDNYDQLSDKGVEQCTRLGRWLAERECSATQGFAGSLVRQQDSLSAIASSVTLNRQTEAGLNEFPFRNILQCFADANPDHELVQAWQKTDVVSTFRLLRRSIDSWQHGELNQAAESWQGFTSRVEHAFEHIHSTHADSLVVASGGSIAWYLSRILQTPLAQWFELNLQINNSAVSEVVVGRNGPRLVRFNHIAHLDRPDLQHLITHS